MAQVRDLTPEEQRRLAVDRARPTGVWLLPPALCRWLHLWSAWDQRRCPHPDHRIRSIHGDERNRGYRWQCRDCGVYAR